MTFFDELNNFLKTPFDDVLDYKYYVISNKAMCVSGYKKIVNYSTENICLGVKRNVLNIEGKDMKIKELDKFSIVIVGEIYRVYLLNES